MLLGLDIGSVISKAVLMDESLCVQGRWWHHSRVLLLNIAKMVDFARRGADGVINVICLNCMLGTVSEAISAQIKRDYERIPIPTLVFSGTDSPSENTKLEAFVYQVHRFAQKKARKIV